MDWEGTQYLGLTLDWDYTKREVHLSMPGYIENALVRFGHKPPDKPQMQPYPHTLPTYGAKIQYATVADTSPLITKAEEKFIRQVIGVLLYYGRAVDSTIITGLGSLAAAQATPTTHTLYLVKWLLDYAATNLNAILTYAKSGMVLAVHSDASYLSISANPKHKAELAATSFARPTTTIHLTTKRYSTYQKYSRPSCPVQPKPNWALCTSTPAKQSPCANFLKRWVTNNRPHLSKPTIALHME